MSVELIVSRLLNPEFVCTELPVILALQETSSWNAEEMHAPGYENVFGLTSLLVSDRPCTSQGQGRSEERCAVLFGFTKVMSVYALGPGKT